MTKMPVLPGVWWVDIPEAGLRILCGAPMDSVKHLIKQGLVRKIEKNGVVFETGPNVILLADTPIQKGRFWNLAEFPVLHMLFKQGLGIPGHPGFDGTRPILTGSPDQVESVLNYIHRGTYGLCSKEEMAESGVPAKDLEELWRLKLQFASGKIKAPHELIGTVPLDGAQAVLPNDVTIRREGRNRYIIMHGDQSVQVDMNLPVKKDWSATYQLSHIDIREGYFSITHTGEGNGWDPDKPCMGSMLSFRGKRYLIDAGPGIDYSLERLGIDIAELNGLFITHAHDDHFAGLTSLLRGDTKIDVFATRPVMATVRYKLSALLGRPPDFMDHLVNIHYLTEDIWNKIEGIEVRPTMSPHPLETTIMFFRALWEGGYKTYAHLADIVSDEVLKRFVKPDGVTSEFRNRVWSEYLRPADVKKIDAGRGLIHGFAEDFADDRSPCLILSHYEGELSDSEKEIGASVAFGQTDILIPARGDRLRDAAEELLSRTLPGLPSEDFDLLLNGTVESIPPDTALLRKGSIPESLLLIITGTVDALESGDNPHLRFTAGSLIGEGEFLNRKPASAAYRSRNHVKAMRIPADLYVHALKKAGWINSRLDILSRRDFLHRGAFPGQVVSCPRLDEIAGSMKEVNWRRGKTTASGVEELYILMSGSVLESESGLEKELQPGALMNIGGVVLFSEKTVNPSWKALTASKVAVIPAAVIRETPVLAWTLAESAAAD